MLYGYSQLDPRTSGGGGLESLLPLGTNSWLRPCRFLLLCSPANSKNVLRQAEHFQTMHKQRSALFMTSQWLVLVDPGAFERSDVSHVSMMHVTFVSCHAGKSCCLPTSPRNDGRCGMVRTLQWRGGDNSVVCLGSVLDILNGGRDVFPARHWGFSGRLLSVSTLPWKGFVELRETAKGTEYSGLCIDLLRQLALLMNFTYQLSQPADGIWGIQYDNGTWAGLIGQLATSEVDMVMAPLTVTYQRELVMDFTYPYFNDADTVIYRKPDPRKDKWRTYLQPLKWQPLKWQVNRSAWFSVVWYTYLQPLKWQINGVYGLVIVRSRTVCGLDDVRNSNVCGLDDVRNSNVCGLDDVRNSNVCGLDDVRNSNVCGLDDVRNSNVCVLDDVRNSNVCGLDDVRSRTVCGLDDVSNSNVCGLDDVRNSNVCGLDDVRSRTVCGLDDVRNSNVCGLDDVRNSNVCGFVDMRSSCLLRKGS
ncbi:hypothetical protein ACOMHN_047431 [Nucella lapillus]